ncbi:response regulator [Amaricoccus macauensis]|uniref:response regulator n=1 Tax=Amaricoccus macauensis TaxID=57001 RepID=UPI003C7E62CD
MTAALRPRILVLEDHWLVAMHTEVLLQELGCDVIGPFMTLEEAISAMLLETPDVGLLDVHLEEGTCFPLASIFEAQGIPFAFATGCTREMVPEQFQGQPHIDKPYTREALGAWLRSAGLLGQPSCLGADPTCDDAPKVQAR